MFLTVNEVITAVVEHCYKTYQLKSNWLTAI